MNTFRKIFLTIVTSVILFVGSFVSSHVPSYAAILPDEAKEIIKESDSVKEAGDRLKAANSSDKLRNHEVLDTKKEVRDRIEGQDNDRIHQDKLISSTQTKLKEAAENVKEKLNLDEPIPESTKEFGREVKGKVDEVKGKVDEVLGKSETAVNEPKRATEQVLSDSDRAVEKVKENAKQFAGKREPGYYQRRSM